jgi:hypothetical protein
MKNVRFFLVMFIIVGLTGCSSYKRMQSPPTLVEFKRQDFEFSEQVVGKATTVRVLGIDWAEIFSSKNGDFKNSVISSAAFTIDHTENKAVFNLLTKNPGYDVVFYPSFESTKTYIIPFLVSKKNVTVRAKLAKIKTDNDPETKDTQLYNEKKVSLVAKDYESKPKQQTPQVEQVSPKRQ